MPESPTKGSATVLVLRETALQSVISDTYSLLCAGVLIGIGVWVGSTAMEWAGFCGFVLFMTGRALRGNSRRSPQEAADFLRDEFGVTATPRAA
jgi:hypothetical protein